MEKYIIEQSKTEATLKGKTIKDIEVLFNKTFKKVFYINKKGEVKEDIVILDGVYYLIKNKKLVKTIGLELKLNLFVLNIKSLDEIEDIKSFKIIAPENSDELITEKIDEKVYKLFYAFKLNDNVVYKMPVSFDFKLPRDLYFKLKDKLNYFRKSNKKKGYLKGEFYLTFPIAS